MTRSPVAGDNQISMAKLLPLLASIVAINPLAIDLYLPAMPIIAEYYSVGIGAVQNSLSAYLAGYAMGLFLFGPLADRIGRRKLALFGLFSFALFSLLIPLSESINTFIMLRFMQAFTGSAATVVVPGIIRQFYGKNTAKGMSYVSMIMMLAPMMAPSIGSVILLVSSWHWIFYYVGLYALLIFVGAYRLLPEAEIPTKPNTVSFFGNYKIVLGHSQARKDIATSMLAAFAFFTYITGIPVVYMQVYGVNDFWFSVLFALNVYALMTAQWLNSRLVVKHGSKNMLRIGFILAIFSASVLALVNALELQLIWTVISIFPVLSGLGLIAVNSDALILMRFEQQAGTATAVIGTLKFGVGAFAGPLLAYFAHVSALPFALIIFCSVATIFLLQYKRILYKKTMDN